MAGDWIKMRVDLGDDPAVVLIAAILDTTEDEVVGKLHRLWSWADRHTTDGTAPAITAKWVDRYVGKSGFAEAMTKASWISFSDGGVTFPSFDRHNGESAKRRGEAAIRQRLSRKNRDEGVTGVERTTIPRPFVRHVMERDDYTCVYCGQESSAAIEASRKALLSVDHIKPVTRGGSAAVENLACCCRKCNSEKNDRTPEEWDLLPTFLQSGVSYKDGQLVEDASHVSRDESVTREEKRREEKKEEKKEEKTPRAQAPVILLPEWLPQNLWDAWQQRSKAKKITQAAADVVIAKLSRWRDAGEDWRGSLENAAIGGYQGLFLPKDKGSAHGVTVPSAPGRDPALLKIEEDEKVTKPPTLETLARLAELRKPRLGAH